MLGEYYGSPVPDVPAGHDLVLEIDVQGAQQVLERARAAAEAESGPGHGSGGAGDLDAAGPRGVQGAGRPGVQVILLVPPSRAEQEARLRRRGDPEEQVQRRLALGDQEVELGRRIADHVVVNDDLGKALEQLAAIIDRSRSEGAV